MRTPLFLLAAVLLLAACIVLARLFSGNYPQAMGWAIGAFIGVWLVISAFNMWVGVTRAGYAVTEELPVFALVFGLPAVLAAVLKWKVF